MSLAALRRNLGYFLIVSGALGIALCAAGLVQVWRMKPVVETGLLEALSTSRQTLELTATTLTNLDAALSQIDENIAAVNHTLLTVAQSLGDTLPVVEGTGKLLQEDLPEMLEATQDSLETAQASAQLLDGVTRAITRLPFYPGEPYNPEVPLHLALQNVAASLEDVPEALIEIGVEMDNNRENISSVEDQLIALSLTLTGLTANIEQTKLTLENYQTLFASGLERIEALETGLPSALETAGWCATLLLVWFMIVQIGLIAQGINLANLFLPVPPEPLD